MTLLLLLLSGLGHKHGGKHLTEYTAVSLLVVLVALSLFPAPALAYESRLPHSSSTKLVATVHLTGQLPEYSHRSSGVMAAELTATTERGDWRPVTRLAQAAVPQETPVRIDSGPVVLEGEASYYSRAGCLGCSPSLTMANGQPLDDTALTMAIGADRKHLVGHTATVTNLTTGQSVDVRITDTGGFYHERYGRRVADLTIATKQAIGMAGGVGQVRVEVH